MKDEIKNLLAMFYSKKFWAMIVAIATPIINKQLGLEYTPAELQAVILPLIAYIVGQGLADMGKNNNKPSNG